ncbi:MAG TPA: amidase family protein [Pseudorhodoferax sp.]|nr:amidase family protein [Pseudorhodoferax sp.]
METPAWQLDIAGLNAAYARGVHGPESVLQSLLTAIAADARGINAFCHLDAETALDQARASARRWQQGQPLGPLDGVPVSIKDLLPVAGWPTRRGSRSTAGDPPAAQDAPLVAQLRAAGAVLFGKTSTTEFGWCVDSHNPHSGTTRNPRDPARSAGGSSSGAAAQIAAGWGPLAIGSDAGGSVRLPASWCGVVGFKPSHGAIPAAPQSAFAEFAHFGPFTRSVADCATAMAVLAQPDARDPASLYPRSTRPRPAPPTRLRIGWVEASADWQPEIAQAYRRLLDQLSDAGHVLVAQPREDLAGVDAMWTVWASRVHESFVDWSDAQRDLLDPALRQLWEEGAAQAPATLARARASLRALAGRVALQFAELDLQLTPATPTTAPLLAAQPAAQPRNWFADNSLAYLFNLTQQPALSQPLGQDAQGLPFNVQITGRRYADELVLDFGRRIEARVAAA